MTEGKSINLLKAAKELNIAIGTAVDFLAKKGFEVEPKPNAKLSGSMYSVLLEGFQVDKIVRDEAKQIIIGKIRREESVAATGGAIADASKSASRKESKAETPAETATEELPQATKQTEWPIAETGTGHFKVLGKIDPAGLTTRSRFVKKSASKPSKDAKKSEKTEAAKKPLETKGEAQPAEKVKPAKTEPAVPEVKAEKPGKVRQESTKAEKKAKRPKETASEKPWESLPKPDAKKEQPAAAVPKPPVEVIRARSETLAGPKVVGKIELPVERPHRPVGSSSNPGNKDSRRRRKRSNKNAGTAANAAAGQQNRGQHAAGNRQGGKGRHDRGRFGSPKEEPTEKEIQDQIKATLARLSGAGKSGKFAQRAKFRRQKRDDVAFSAEEAAMEREAQSRILKVTEFVTANELANLMDVPVTQIISTCMSLGLFVSINQRLDAETLTIVADEFGFQVEFIRPEDEEITELEEPDNEENMVPRAPIVTVMGHVDHGKTSLLDYIRKANVTKGEAGGITQHIGAYAVRLDDGRKITFLDTPGHEAFTAMRARGAQVTDIVIIVIAADDAVMPQTREAINHAQAAGSPIVFAFTKVDKPGANADRIREQLSAMNIVVEEWGGKYQAQEISAKTGENVELLLEKVLLEAEMLGLRADPKKRSVGSVIEAALDKGRGIVTTVLVQSGTLRVGDPILAGSYSGKVKALTNERGERVKEAGPSVPVQILGMSGAPTAGDRLYVLESESEARLMANKRLQLQREQGMRATKHITLDEIGRRLAIGNFKELNVIVKGDVDGSIEALSDSLLKLSTDEIQVNVIHKSVGAISETDVLLASASDAIIIGFQVRPTQGAKKLAENEQIDVRLYSIIYDAIEELRAAMEGMLAPKFEEKIVAEVEIREIFKITKVGTIAGCMVREGKITRNNDVRLVRDGVVIHSGKLASLKRFKDDVKEVAQGYECGLNIDRFNDIQIGDIVEAYEQVEVKRKL